MRWQRGLWALSLSVVWACGDDGGAATSAAAGGAGGAGGAAAVCEPAAEPLGTDVAGGESFPDLTFTRCDGSKLGLDALRCGGQLTVLSFGAGWCAPCREEAPELEAASQQLRDRGVVIAQVMLEDAAGLPATSLFCDNWTAEHQLTIPVLIDPVKNSLEYFELAQSPLTVIVDRDGKVLFADSGKPDDILALIESFL